MIEWKQMTMQEAENKMEVLREIHKYLLNPQAVTTDILVFNVIDVYIKIVFMFIQHHKNSLIL